MADKESKQMSTSVDPFIIPDGLHIENSSNGFLIEHQGDIVIKSATGLSALQQNHNSGLRLRSTNGNIVLELTDAEAQNTPRFNSLEASSCPNQLQHSERFVVHGQFFEERLRINEPGWSDCPLHIL